MSAAPQSLGGSEDRIDAARYKQIEAALARMTKVFLDSADPIVIRDMEGNVLDINHETERVFGWSREELLGQHTKHLIAPQFQQQADEVVVRMQRGETIRNVESSVRTKSGEHIPVLGTAFLLTDENSQPVGYAQIVKDISLLKRTTDELAQRNRELQQFANVLAHDLAAPLRSIRSFADLLQQDWGSGLSDDCQEHLQFITAGVARMERMIDDLVSYTRLNRSNARFEPVDCSEALSEAMSNLHAAIEECNAEITHDPLPTIQGNKTQLIQLMQNLIANALKFRGFDRPQIHVGSQRTDDAWQISVRDNGIGIDAAYHEKVFEVFRRLHGDHVYPGTGMGLAICQTIVERHSGRIWVESEKGKGSTFHFTFPDSVGAKSN